MHKSLLSAVVGLMLLSPSANAADYVIIVKSALLENKKPDGQDWDFAGGLPDPYVKIGTAEGDGSYRLIGSSTVRQNTLRPDWNEVVCSVNLDDDLCIEVMDKDVAKDDVGGQYKITVTSRMIAEGEIRVAFDQIRELRFVIRRR